MLKYLNIMRMGVAPGDNCIKELVVECMMKAGKCHFLPIEKFEVWWIISMIGMLVKQNYLNTSKRDDLFL